MNFKKIFSKKHSKNHLSKYLKAKISNAFRKKTFYFALVLFIAIISATLTLVTTYKITSSKDYDTQKILAEDTNQSFGMDLDIRSAKKAPVNSSIDSQNNKKENEQIRKGNENNVNKIKDDKKSDKILVKNQSEKRKTIVANDTTKDTGKFVMPVLGNIVVDFDKNKLIYSKTLNEWRTHKGIDILADKGTKVKVVADGYIRDVRNDSKMGITIEVQHTNGIKTIYSNLANNYCVVVNEIVRQGDILGYIGNSAAFESAEQPHLHFEIIKNGVQVNPREMFCK